jgi:hypothetical protein
MKKMLVKTSVLEEEVNKAYGGYFQDYYEIYRKSREKDTKIEEMVNSLYVINQEIKSLCFEIYSIAASDFYNNNFMSAKEHKRLKNMLHYDDYGMFWACTKDEILSDIKEFIENYGVESLDEYMSTREEIFETVKEAHAKLKEACGNTYRAVYNLFEDHIGIELTLSVQDTNIFGLCDMIVKDNAPIEYKADYISIGNLGKDEQIVTKPLYNDYTNLDFWSVIKLIRNSNLQAGHSNVIVDLRKFIIDNESENESSKIKLSQTDLKNIICELIMASIHTGEIMVISDLYNCTNIGIEDMIELKALNEVMAYLVCHAVISPVKLSEVNASDLLKELPKVLKDKVHFFAHSCSSNPTSALGLLVNDSNKLVEQKNYFLIYHNILDDIEIDVYRDPNSDLIVNITENKELETDISHMLNK